MTTKRERCSQKSVRRNVDDSSAFISSAIFQQCPKQKHFSSVLIAIFSIYEGGVNCSVWGTGWEHGGHDES